MADHPNDSSAPRLLSGGNPQIPKGDGDGPVQDYIAAMPEWKSDIGRRVDALIAAAIPDVRKAVKWNQPFYGTDGETWLLGFRCFTKYVQLQFLKGADLTPQPPRAAKDPDTRYLDIYVGDDLDEDQLTAWFEQIRPLPGAKL